jgi:hypothetical protein
MSQLLQPVPQQRKMLFQDSEPHTEEWLMFKLLQTTQYGTKMKEPEPQSINNQDGDNQNTDTTLSKSLQTTQNSNLNKPLELQLATNQDSVKHTTVAKEKMSKTKPLLKKELKQSVELLSDSEIIRKLNYNI